MEHDSDHQPYLENQLTLLQMFGWLTLSCLVLASIASLASLGRSMFGAGEINWASQFLPSAITWVVLLLVCVRRANFAAIAIHTIPVLVISAVALLTRAMEFGAAISSVLACCTVSSAASFAYLGKSSLARVLRHALTPSRFFVGVVLLGVFLTAAICTLPQSLDNQRLDFPSLIFGALLGFWLGIYQAVAKSDSAKKPRISGVRLYQLVLAGLLGAIGGPILNEVIARQYFGAYFILPRFSPAIGFATAGLTFVLLWLNQRKTAKPPDKSDDRLISQALNKPKSAIVKNET